MGPRKRHGGRVAALIAPWGNCMSAGAWASIRLRRASLRPWRKESMVDGGHSSRAPALSQ
eukprot:6155159-Amphidinium_carterae.1